MSFHFQHGNGTINYFNIELANKKLNKKKMGQ